MQEVTMETATSKQANLNKRFPLTPTLPWCRGPRRGGDRENRKEEGQRHDERSKEKQQEGARYSEDDERWRPKMAKERMDGDFVRIDESSAN
ncbi:hypothetical protein TNCV_1803921 [Trichonephila clavipes]|nr:hypothetical protein TNCV_1803921 [Trichonephila clavipes]